MKAFIKRFVPSHQSVQALNLQRFFGEKINDPRLWVINRKSMSKAVGIGLFCAYMPVPLQMLPAALLAIFARANLPVAASIVWISNPLTFVFFFTPPYLLGLAITREGTFDNQAFSIMSVTDNYLSLLIGCLLFGTAVGVSGFVLVRLIWRQIAVNKWHGRVKNQ